MLAREADLAQTGALTEDGYKTAALVLNPAKGKPLSDHDRPGNQGKKQKEKQDGVSKWTFRNGQAHETARIGIDRLKCQNPREVQGDLYLLFRASLT